MKLRIKYKYGSYYCQFQFLGFWFDMGDEGSAYFDELKKAESYIKTYTEHKKQCNLSRVIKEYNC